MFFKLFHHSTKNLKKIYLKFPEKLRHAYLKFSVKIVLIFVICLTSILKVLHSMKRDVSVKDFFKCLVALLCSSLEELCVEQKFSYTNS